MNKLTVYDSSSDEEEQRPLKKTRQSNMPPLGSFFHTQARVTDKGKDGRKRAVPHTVNSWATYVYFQVDLAEGDKDMLLGYCNGLTPIEQQHLSISKTVYLKEHQLDPFVKAVRDSLEGIKPFTMSFAQLSQLTNDEKTRSFVTLEVGAGYNELSKCMKSVDKVMKGYHQPVFYDPPRFHTSIAWSLQESTIKALNIPKNSVDAMIINTFTLSRLFIKQGNRINYIDLGN